MKPWKPISAEMPSRFAAILRVTLLLAMKYSVGSTKVTPITRPQMRCVHSMK
jgi:hypothetical protein